MRDLRRGRRSPAPASLITASTSPRITIRFFPCWRSSGRTPSFIFAEQKSAPYSMKSSKHKRFTLDNNLNATNNVLAAIVEAELNSSRAPGNHGCLWIRLFRHQDSRGLSRDPRRGYRGQVNRRFSIRVPRQYLSHDQDAGSVAFSFYNMNDDLKITDLHQGIVWETRLRKPVSIPG